MMIRLLCLLMVAGLPALADVIVPARTIRAREIIAAEDLLHKTATVPGALADVSQIIGQEARSTLYPGRPIRPGDVGPPALIDRNEIVTLIFLRGGLQIVTEGRALGRGAAGETVRAVNTASRLTVSGLIRADGSIEVR